MVVRARFQNWSTALHTLCHLWVWFGGAGVGKTLAATGIIRLLLERIGTFSLSLKMPMLFGRVGAEKEFGFLR